MSTKSPTQSSARTGTSATRSAPASSALSQNGLRQCLRVAGGGTLGFIISQLMGWNYGVFFTVFPMFLLGLVPVLNGSIIRQFLSNVSLNVLEVSLVVGLLKHMPVVMTLVVLGLFLLRFNLMAKGPLFLFGANGVLTLSILLHFASYPGVDLSDLLASNLMASVLAVFIAMLMYTLFPDREPRQLILPSNSGHLKNVIRYAEVNHGKIDNINEEKILYPLLRYLPSRSVSTR